HETVRAAVIADMTTTSGLTEAELSVLVCLYESGGTLRQNAIAATLGWDRTRLSHQLTRMEKRDYVTRATVPNGVDAPLRPEGRRTIEAPVPPLDAATRRHLLGRLGPDGGAALTAVVARLRSSDDSR